MSEPITNIRTVGELIEALQSYPKDMPLEVCGAVNHEVECSPVSKSVTVYTEAGNLCIDAE